MKFVALKDFFAVETQCNYLHGVTYRAVTFLQKRMVRKWAKDNLVRLA